MRRVMPGLKPAEEVVTATRDGAADGAEAGSRFGPLGAGVGAGVGAAFGFLGSACPVGRNRGGDEKGRSIEVTEAE
ncbi:hypothetical protein [Haloglomus litoreum]|uniref:hypothetical protein n=1 Tax=Haloglomus litoreum TaxID=3034026 RepID=UPI0023E7626A|nr:hypothetical protein [Haloglomus sp. DT116]